MKRVGVIVLTALVLTFIISWCSAQTGTVDRQPAVAGQFYPSQKDDLRATLKNLFATAVPPKGIKSLLAVISPHAGYVYSGEVAASSFNQIDPAKEYENIFILGPSHRIGFEGAAMYSKGDFVTPLGIVRVNRDLAGRLAKQHTILAYDNDAHTYEHSIEVQLPFLQARMKKDFRIVPIVIGAGTPEACQEIADALHPYLTPQNLFVISTDFSHYPSYNDALKVDKATADAIVANSPEDLVDVIRANERKGIHNLATSMCGLSCVLTLLYMTHDNAEVAMQVVQYRNSGDSQIGDKDRVVGYYSIVVSQKEKKERAKFSLSEKDKRSLLSIARATITRYLTDKHIPILDTSSLAAPVKLHCGAFVTLQKHGALRGCIGRFDSSEPLHTVVQAMAVAAATEDHRFPPVERNEVDGLEIEISVLTPMRKISSIDEITLGQHGVYIKKGYRAGTFLPQVATETGWSKEEFLGHCAQDKAGLGWEGWKDAEVYVFEANVFSEKDVARR